MPRKLTWHQRLPSTQPITVARRLAPMLAMIGCSGPGPERMLRSVLAVAMVWACAAPIMASDATAADKAMRFMASSRGFEGADAGTTLQKIVSFRRGELSGTAAEGAMRKFSLRFNAAFDLAQCRGRRTGANCVT